MALAAAMAVLLIFAGVIVSLVIGSIPAFKAFGFAFIIDRGLESHARSVRRAWPSIYGTLVTSLSPC